MAAVAFITGIFVIFGAILNWDWFFTSWRAEIFVRLFGRNGARVFYGILGIGFILMGFLLLRY
jgi:hypothetical protein